MATVTGPKKNKSEGLRKRKNVLQQEHVEACKEFQRILGNNDEVEINIHWKQVNKINKDLCDISEQYLELMSEALSEEDVKQEYDAIHLHEKSFLKCEVMYEHRSKKNITPTDTKDIYRLPRLDIRQFDGAPQNWLPFWHQFKRIHEDANIRKEDKLQYLHQYTTGRVKDLVVSYPQLEENYDIVLGHVKERFADEKTLVRYYVKEILKLVTSNKFEIKLDFLYRNLDTKLRALTTLGATKDKYCDILLPLVEAALPDALLMHWHRHFNNLKGKVPGDSNELEVLLNFLRIEVENEEKVRDAKSVFSGSSSTNDACNKNKNKFTGKGFPTAAALVKVEGKRDSNCIFCGKDNHWSLNCSVAIDKPLNERWNIVEKKNACFGCLRVGHRSSDCKVKAKCVICHSQHATLLCRKLMQNSNEQNSDVVSQKTATCCSQSSKMVGSYLPVVVVKIRHNGKEKRVRALFDSGCQRSYVSYEVASELSLKAKGYETLSNYLFGGVVAAPEKHSVFSVDISNLEDTFYCEVQVLGEKELCSFVPSLESSAINNFPRIKFTDVNNREPLALILGADVFGQLFTGKTVKGVEGLVALETHLGWVLTGPSSCKGNLSMFTVCLKNIELPTLWDVDIIGIRDPIEVKSEKKMNEETLEHFKANLKIDEKGRYSVALPWKENHAVLADNRAVAEKRLLAVTDRLFKNNYYQMYEEVFVEWQKSGIIEVVPETDVSCRGHYLPHRPIIKLHKEKSKIRPVFDASCTGLGNVSLNSCLNKGPNLLELIPPLLIRFRLGKYGIVGDIEKAFLQIEVREADRDFLRFLWWEKQEVPRKIKVYRHKRVVFGVCCSPFLLNAVIAHHLDECEKQNIFNSDFVRKLGSSFYVDDCVTSVHNLSEISEFIENSEKALRNACFKLRGWKSNGTPEAELEDTNTSVLGLNWELSKDELACVIPDFNNLSSQKPTKRLLLSVTSRVFDPLGFTAPVSLLPKLLLQEVWKLGLKWDELLPDEIAKRFQNWCDLLSCLKHCKIPRWLFRETVDWERCTLHVFCDASKLAYAAVVFIRSEDENGVNVQMVAAKNRVAPIKEVTIPRLELMSACIAIRLAEMVSKTLPKNLNITYWTDSKVVLAWIQKNEPWTIFVENRVKEIREKCDPDSWRHVPGHMNPADLPSRGCSASVLLEKKWWNGPDWLLLEPDQWPCEKGDVSDEILNSERKGGLCLISIQGEKILDRLIRYFSGFSRIIRMCAWMLRWRVKVAKRLELKNTKSPQKRKELMKEMEELKGELRTSEVIVAEKRVMKIFQSEVITNENLKAFEGHKLFTDKDGLLRLDSRISQGEDPENFRKPIILIEHELIKRMIFEKHCKLGHAGVLTTLSQLRETFFVLRGRRLVRRVINSCMICKKLRLKPIVVSEAPLPVDRIKRVSAFQVTGVDLAGPLFLRNGKKAWIALFTCAVYRAIHLELVDSLSTETFIMALRRFIARRGRVSVIYSDNGKNFVGAKNLLNKLDWEKIHKDATIRRISWKSNPPSAPWWGGWWERMIGVMKELLKKNLGRSIVNYVELETLLCDIEAVVNSRPLTYLSDDPNEPTVLTPAHFILELTENGTEDLDVVDRKYLSKRMKYIQKMRELIRERFRKEYLGELIYRKGKQNNTLTRVAVGDLVLVEDQTKRRIFWPLGKIIELIPGKDGNYRLARLLLRAGQVLRPLNRLYPLEINGENPQSHCITEMFKTKSGRVVKPVTGLNL